jgi:phosphoribosylglycinamide formyltransferase 2
VLAHGTSKDVRYTGVDSALSEPGTQVRLFGKPEVDGERRMGVALALGEDTDEAREKAASAAQKIGVHLS